MSTQPGPDAPTKNPLIAVATLCFGGVSVAMTQTMIIPIQSELPRLLETSATNAGWIITITLLTSAVAMPVGGRLADLFGKQRVLFISAVVLAVGSLVCALSDTLAPMLGGRALQGLAMGYIPVGISLIREIMPARQATTAIAAMSATMGVGGAIGLPLSAWIADGSDWHALFWLATALAVIATLGTVLLVPHLHDGSSGRVDLVGAVGLAIGLISFLVGVSKGNEWGWTSARTIGAMVLGLLTLLLWGWFELRQSDPLVDLRASAQLPVLFTNLATVAVGFGMMAQAVVIPQLLQLPAATGHGLGQSLLAVGLWMAPSGLFVIFFAPVSSGLVTKIGARKTLAIGSFVLGLGYAAGFLLMGAPWQLLIASIIAAAGVGIGFAAMPTLVMDAVDPRSAGSAMGVNGLMRSVGTTTAAAVMVSILTSSTIQFEGASVPSEGAFQACFIVGALSSFLAVFITLFIPRSAPDAVAPHVAESSATADLPHRRARTWRRSSA